MSRRAPRHDELTLAEMKHTRGPLTAVVAQDAPDDDVNVRCPRCPDGLMEIAPFRKVRHRNGLIETLAKSWVCGCGLEIVFTGGTGDGSPHVVGEREAV